MWTKSTNFRGGHQELTMIGNGIKAQNHFSTWKGHRRRELLCRPQVSTSTRKEDKWCNCMETRIKLLPWIKKLIKIAHLTDIILEAPSHFMTTPVACFDWSTRWRFVEDPFWESWQLLILWRIPKILAISSQSPIRF